MSVADLKRFFDTHRGGGSLVLATVYETDGSTYSKAGARMLINAAGDFQGMLSGGCLEGDLAERASQVVETGDTQSVTYDMRGEDDVLWGLGVGCEGMMRIFLQPLTAASGYRPFPEIVSLLEGDRSGAIATVVASRCADASPGGTLLTDGNGAVGSGIPEPIGALLRPLLDAALAESRTGLHEVAVGEQSVTVLISLLEPPPRVLILGAGLDAEPVLRLCAGLGWRVTVQDHRQSYIDKGDFSLAERVHCLPAASVHAEVDLARFDAAIVMSHHLLTDREYLAQLADASLRYVGLLGPPKRRQRLIAELGEKTPARLHGPAGIDIGGRGPQSIALSIVAEMHRVLIGRSDAG